MKMLNWKRRLLMVALMLLASGVVGKELFAAATVTELNEQNYRKEITLSGKCIVMYYAAAWKYTAEGKAFMKELQHKFPYVTFFAVDLKKFKRKAEVDKIFAEDISAGQVPSFIGYAKGRVVIRNAGAPLSEKETKEALNSFVGVIGQ